MGVLWNLALRHWQWILKFCLSGLLGWVVCPLFHGIPNIFDWFGIWRVLRSGQSLVFLYAVCGVQGHNILQRVIPLLGSGIALTERN